MANGNNATTNEEATANKQCKQEPRSMQKGPHPTAAEATEASAMVAVNDLVADLCQNERMSDSSGIRPTFSGTTSATTGSGPASSSSFSFKHFLSSTGTVTAPTSTVTSVDAPVAVQTSTGARPKVPQSASTFHMQPSDANGSSASSKMKRSPRFSSFDSQASLAEYAACGGGPGCSSGSQRRLRPDLRMENHAVDDDHVALAQVRNSRLYDEHADEDIFPSAASNLQAAEPGFGYVQRSYSSYEMPRPGTCPSSSPRRRQTGNREQRPNRLVLPCGPKLKLDLPLDTVPGTCATTSCGSAATAALPDFVQDHLPDARCASQEARLSSPPQSPLGAAEAPCGPIGQLPSALASIDMTSAGAISGTAGEAPAGSTVKMLPDFLSDGPIMHSSQRLADVAIGLPSNSIDSPPQEAVGTLQLSSLLQENESLKRELQETRFELNAQTRRANDFEKQLLQLTESTRRRETVVTAANTQTTQRLRRQVSALEAELCALRSANASDGAAGGVPVVTPVSGSGSATSSGSNSSRPSRTQQLSRDLMRAADTAEQNLRQLLTGVENLRQMAANLDQPVEGTTSPCSPDLYSDFN
ncbi:hypothetical protein KR067_004914 [Drosophila pandora]|nr:hypothetical protein KR067_004914 [Drosophila pandora]